MDGVVLSSPLWTILILGTTSICYVNGANNTLYPYGDETDDVKIENIGPQHTVDIRGVAPIKYYGQSFKTVYILKDGMVAFEPGVTFLDEVKWKEGTPQPTIDLPFIAPFHHNGLLAINNLEQYPGKIYYKLLLRCRSCQQLSQKDQSFVQELDSYVQSASVVLKSGFTSEFVFKVTWENVTSKENCSNQDFASCAFNTFQLVLVGNAYRTFAIFNYYKMDIPFNDHHLAGMNGGHSRGWTDVVPCTGTCAKRSKSEATRITSLPKRYGSDVKGRYILVVDEDKIYRGGCVPVEIKDAELAVFPRQAGMFGGEMLSVSGKCLEPQTTIFCRFAGSNKQITQGVMETKMRGRCPVPILTTRGEVSLELSSDNIKWPYKTKMTILLPSRLGVPIDLQGIIEAWYQIETDVLRIRWKSDLFSANSTARLDLTLIGYREDGYGENKLVFRPLEQLAVGLLNSDEEHAVDPSRFTCQQNCQDFEVALVQLKIADEFIDQTTKYQAVTVGPVTLGWYVKQAMTQHYGTTQWSAAKCIDWNNQDRLSTVWLDHLQPCPCTLTQALADWGRWQPDVGCSMFSGSVCRYHQHALHCVRSVHPSPDGSGNQCCYEHDGSLRYAADTYQGSTPDRSHDWGAAPYGVPGRVPSLSHWIHDVVTFYYCCLWVEDYAGCDYYMNRRPTKDCNVYTPPHAATVYGDPHITTFDGYSYHFGGSGDFWLIKSATINIQGRFEPRPNENLKLESGQIVPTNLTSIVMWTPESDVITVRKAPIGGLENRMLDIMVGPERRFFEEQGTLWQDFKRVSVVNNKDVAASSKDKNHSNFTILFEGGVGVQVAERQGLFHVVVILPTNKTQTRGLLGTLDGDITNELTTPHGYIIPIDTQEDNVYHKFAITWNVSESDSKFVWPRKAVPDKVPLFGDPESFVYKEPAYRPVADDVNRKCGTSRSCKRDYYVTNDNLVALDSKTAEENFASLQKSQIIVRSCGLLDIPSAVKSPPIYLEGVTVTVTGCRDGSPFQTQGPKTYLCNTSAASPSTPVWSPLPDRNLCPTITDVAASPRKASGLSVGVIAGIVIGIVVAVAIVVVIVVVIRRRRSSSGRSDRDDKPVPATRTKVPKDAVEVDVILLNQKDDDRDNNRKSDVKRSML